MGSDWMPPTSNECELYRFRAWQHSAARQSSRERVRRRGLSDWLGVWPRSAPGWLSPLLAPVHASSRRPENAIVRVHLERHARAFRSEDAGGEWPRLRAGAVFELRDREDDGPVVIVDADLLQVRTAPNR